MKIEITLDFAENATMFNVERALNDVFEMARFAAATNAIKTTTTFDGSKPKFCIKMDDELRKVLRFDVDKAQRVIANGNPCNNCVDEYICEHTCDSLGEYGRAKDTILQARAYCTKECEQFANGTCPFPGVDIRECPKYKFD